MTLGQKNWHVNYLKENMSIKRIRVLYQNVYDVYQNSLNRVKRKYIKKKFAFSILTCTYSLIFMGLVLKNDISAYEPIR